MKRVIVQTQQVLQSSEPPLKRKKTSEPSIGVAFESHLSNETLPLLTPLLWLNSDCLSQVLSYLGTYDLINMCLASDQLQDAILSCDLRSRVFNFDELRCCHFLKCFKIFGQQMTRMKMSDRYIDFDKFLHLISTYCLKDTIKHLAIKYHKDSRLSKVSLHNVLPFFRQLESFDISETDGFDRDICVDYFSISRQFNKSVNDFVERVLVQAANIKSIKLVCVKVTGRFLHLPLQNLQTLQFIRCNIQNSLPIFLYLKASPGLMQFTWIDSSVRGIDDFYTNSSDLIFNMVTNNLLDLKIFEYAQNEVYISNSGRIKMHTIYEPPVVSLLQNLKKLQKLAIEVYGAPSCDLLAIFGNYSIKELCFDPPLLYFGNRCRDFRGYQKLDYYIQV